MRNRDPNSRGIVLRQLLVIFDNVRGDFDSQLLESVLRGTGSIAVRLPYRAEVVVHTDRIITQFTSNKANLSPDLANRSIITNNRKQPQDYKPTLPWGPDFLHEVSSNQALYLGSVHTVVREWILKGKPRNTSEDRHSFKDWVQSLDWIVQNIFQLPPLMGNHAATQDLLSDITLSWFRDVVMGAVRSQQLDVRLQANDIREICDSLLAVNRRSKLHPMRFTCLRLIGESKIDWEVGAG
jgi:hypothetical protein